MADYTMQALTSDGKLVNVDPLIVSLSARLYNRSIGVNRATLFPCSKHTLDYLKKIAKQLKKGKEAIHVKELILSPTLSDLLGMTKWLGLSNIYTILIANIRRYLQEFNCVAIKMPDIEKMKRIHLAIHTYLHEFRDERVPILRLIHTVRRDLLNDLGDGGWGALLANSKILTQLVAACV